MEANDLSITSRSVGLLHDLEEMPVTGSAWHQVNDRSAYTGSHIQLDSVLLRSEEPDRSLDEPEVILGTKYYWITGHPSGSPPAQAIQLFLAVATSYFAHAEELITWPDQLLEFIEEEEEPFRGVVALRHEREIAFTHSMERKTSELDRWKPKINIEPWELDEDEE